MRVKIKDLELVLEHIKVHSVAESVNISFSSDEIGLCFNFTDNVNLIAEAKVFDANINVTPEIKSTKKLYRED